MNRQSLDLMRPKFLPKYGDDACLFEKGKRYIFRKKETAEEPASNVRAIRKFDLLGDALEWARNNLGHDCFAIVSV